VHREILDSICGNYARSRKSTHSHFSLETGIRFLRPWCISQHSSDRIAVSRDLNHRGIGPASRG
jgi:hypothetical protein